MNGQHQIQKPSESTSKWLKNKLFLLTSNLFSAEASCESSEEKRFESEKIIDLKQVKTETCQADSMNE